MVGALCLMYMASFTFLLCQLVSRVSICVFFNDTECPMAQQWSPTPVNYHAEIWGNTHDISTWTRSIADESKRRTRFDKNAPIVNKSYLNKPFLEPWTIYLLHDITYAIVKVMYVKTSTDLYWHCGWFQSYNAEVHPKTWRQRTHRIGHEHGHDVDSKSVGQRGHPLIVGTPAVMWQQPAFAEAVKHTERWQSDVVVAAATTTMLLSSQSHERRMYFSSHTMLWWGTCIIGAAHCTK